MDQFCDDLRSERERRNVSLETLGDITKVSPHYLRALEAGDYAVLPGGVFRRGIVRGYLAALGIDDQPWLQRFEAALLAGGEALAGSPDLTEFAENVSRGRPLPENRRDARWLGVVAMVLAVVLLGWCLVHFVLRGHVVLSRLLTS